MPGQAEEEVNQLTYMQKHMPSLLSLLAETTEEGENSTKVSSSIINYPLSWTMLLSGQRECHLITEDSCNSFNAICEIFSV